MDNVNAVISAVRRVIRAVDLNSKRLQKECGLTAPQLLLLSLVEKYPGQTITFLSEEIALSQGTVTIILDKLQGKGLIERSRCNRDKRKFLIKLTNSGQQLLGQAPSPLQESFLQNFANLKDWEQTQILSSLQRLAALMDAKSLDASPVLEVGLIARPDAQTGGRKKA